MTKERMNENEDFEWDDSKKYTTKWSSVSSKVQKGRRAYGRRATTVARTHSSSQDVSTFNFASKSKKRALQERSQSSSNKNLQENMLEKDSNDHLIKFSTRRSTCSLTSSFSTSHSLDQSLLNSMVHDSNSHLALSSSCEDIHGRSSSNLSSSLSSKSSHHPSSSSHRPDASQSFLSTRLEKPLSTSSHSHDIQQKSCHRLKSVFGDEENRHPNNSTLTHKSDPLIPSSNHTTPFPPTKLKKILSSPSPRDGRTHRPITTSTSKDSYGTRRKIHRLPLSGHLSSSTFTPTESRNQATSPLSTFSSSNNSRSSSFSSISRSEHNTWMKASLQECIEKWRVKKSTSEKFGDYHMKNNEKYATNQNKGADNRVTSVHSPFLSTEDLADVGTPIVIASPTKSTNMSACSSRKRGVCDSPILDIDDASFHSSLSVSRSISRCGSTNSYRSRARSRIFSPASSKKMLALSSSNLNLGEISKNIDKSQHSHRNYCMNHDSDSDTASTVTKNLLNLSCESEMNDNCSSDDDQEIRQNPNDEEIFALPPKPRRTSSVNSQNCSFEDSVFGPVHEKEKPTSRNYKNHIMDTMSSYDDFKFLIRELRKRLNVGNPFASFGMGNRCTIVPPNIWESARKAAFIRWTTGDLGFMLRSGGVSVCFLQISCSKGSELLKKLEVALLNHKKTLSKTEEIHNVQDTRKNYATSCEKKSMKDKKAPFSCIKIIQKEHCSFEELSCLSRSTTKKETKTPSVTGRSLDRDVDGDLANTLASLDIKPEEPIGMNILNSPDLLSPFEKDDQNTPSFVRTITLENADQVPGTNNTETSESSFFPRGRLSSEGSARHGVSLTQFMHGISPNEPNNPQKPMLSLPRRNINHISPHYRNDIPTLSNTPLSFDATETPMPKRCLMSGFRSGRDWGGSEKCPDDIAKLLLANFEKSYKSACKYDGSPLCDDEGLCSSTVIMETTPFVSISSFVRKSINETAADSNALGFEYEADNSRLEIEDDEDNDQSCKSEDALIEIDDDASHDLYKSNNHENMGSFTFADLDLNDERPSPQKIDKRKKMSIAKHSRMSICASAMSNQWATRLSVVHSKAFSRDRRVPSHLVQEINEEESLVVKHQNVIDGTPMKLVSLTTQEKLADPAFSNPLIDGDILSKIFSFMKESDLLKSVSPVCHKWAEQAAFSHANIMLASVGCHNENSETDIFLGSNTDQSPMITESVAQSMQRSWNFLTDSFPWAMFLGEGAFKRVYKVWNNNTKVEEAVSVMDINLIDSLGNTKVIGTELAVSVLLSSLVKRKICPNFVNIKNVFTCQHEPCASNWGDSENPKPFGNTFDPARKYPKAREPLTSSRGFFQYIRMEYCRHGDVEEFLKRQKDSCVHPNDARILLFQMAFGLYSAQHQFGLKHYDVKLLNFFLQNANEKNIDIKKHPFTVLRYGIGSHTFNLRMPSCRAMIAKLADYGTADMQPESNGQPVTIAQFTTIENTPPDYMILGDGAKQGYGHDCFGLGLCMLHLFTGHAPYEEIMETVYCPPNFLKKLKSVWEKESSSRFEVIRSLILSDVYEDEHGNLEGERDETIYHTFYRFLVLIGIPNESFQKKVGNKIWRIISQCLKSDISDRPNRGLRRRNNDRQLPDSDADIFQRDQRQFSILYGDNEKIARARSCLQKMDGGIELLLTLLSFDPDKRATALDVINSNFMMPLRENLSQCNHTDLVQSFLAYKTTTDA